MRPNPLAGGAMPDTLEIGGSRIPIDPGWRAGVRIMRALGSAEEDAARAEAALAIAFGVPLPSEVASNRAEALEALVAWIDFNEPAPPPTARQRRLAARRAWDWDYDAEAAVADFQRFYGIDLTDPATDMHWWRFWALFRGLPPESASMELMGVRSADEEDYKGEALRGLRERKRRAALPARTEEEALRNMELLNG